MSELSPSTSDTTAPPESVAISVEGVSASYRVRMGDHSWRVGLSGLRRGAGSMRLIPALQDVSFTVPKGSVLGVVGRNGAGKSTLLRVIAGIIPPRQGRVVVRGEISALLSAGFGFNRALPGRANVELGAIAMGFPEDRVKELLESVTEFTQLGEYIDFPMRGYSTGMSTRLGFALAAHLDPEILLIDEALAGGDSKFKERIGVKMKELCRSGRTAVIVSHSLAALRSMSTACMWLHQGKIVEHGDPEEVITRYARYCRLDEDLGDE
jgi:teichoic acid transport system ATP-binding protein